MALLNELEAAGFVERRRSPQDRRRHTVVLTPAGAKRLTEVETALAGSERRLFARLGPDEQAALQALLQRATAATAGVSDAMPSCVADEKSC